MPVYRPDVDGLRALAVSVVVLFHADLEAFSGGYIGVDVFFVISGYLITSIILSDCERRRFSLFHFYERRIRRIFPALFAMIAGSTIAAVWLLLPTDLSTFSDALTATTLFVSNFYFLKESGYFAPDVELNVLLHTWSVAVEEQFYILFPITLATLVRFARNYVTPVFLLLAGLSFGLNIWLTTSHPDAAFYLFPTRAWELLLGAILAAHALPKFGPALREASAAAGLTLILWSVTSFSDHTSFPGWAAVAPCLGTALIIHAGQCGPSTVGRILSLRPVVFVGLVSYSLYLWHWPVLAFLKYDYFLKHSYVSPKLEPSVVCLALGASTILAVLSWRYVERPFRNHTWLSRPWIFRGGGVVMASAVCLAVTLKVSDGFPQRFDTAALQFAAGAEDRDPRSRACLRHDPADVQLGRLCTLGGNRKRSYVLWGDSHAGAVLPAVEEAFADSGQSGLFVGGRGCPPLLGVTRAYRGNGYKCQAFNDAVMDRIGSHPDIDTVILAARWSINAEGRRYKQELGRTVFLSDDQSESVSFDENREVFERGLARTLRALRQADKRVIIVGPIPEVGFDVPKSLAMQYQTGVNWSIAPSYKDFMQRQAFVLAALHAAAKAYGAELLLPHETLCTERFCRILKANRTLYVNDDHLSVFGAKQLVHLFK